MCVIALHPKGCFLCYLRFNLILSIDNSCFCANFVVFDNEKVVFMDFVPNVELAKKILEKWHRERHRVRGLCHEDYVTVLERVR